MGDRHATLPRTMRAAVYRERGSLSIEERPLPEIGPDDVLLEVAYCGVCGTDLHLVLDGWGKPDSILGHEYTGRVVAVGSEVVGWGVGDEALEGQSEKCGRCRYCLAGRRALCVERETPGTDTWQGAFAGYTVVAAAELLRVPEGVGLRVAALTEPLAVALHAITVGRVQPDHRVLVSGVGPIGALIVAALVADGHDDVAAVEPNPARQELARRLGAAKAVAPDQLEEPGWDPGAPVTDARDVVFECSGKRQAIEAGFGQLGRAGRLVIVGTGLDPPAFDVNRIILSELEVTGAYTYDDSGFEDALRLLGSGDFPTDILLEPDDVPLTGLLDAMHDLAEGRLAGKVLAVPTTDTAPDGH